MQSLLIVAALGNFVITEWETAPAPTGGFVITEWAASVDIDRAANVLLSDSKPLATAEAAHTPLAEVNRVLDLLPRPEIGFVDLGCGYDARWCIAAAEKWGCRVTGVENDPARAAAARERVRNLGLDHLITIVEGDVGTAEIQGDVAVAYLYPELLARLKPRLEYFRAFASYMHEAPGLPMQRNGDSWLYRKPAAATPTVAYRQPQTNTRQAVWQGVRYSQPVCTSRGCQMCASIRNQLGL